MNPEITLLYQLIKRFRLDWRHPDLLGRIVKKIEKDRLTPEHAKRWLKKIRPLIEAQQQCFNPLPPAPTQDQLGKFDIEIGELIEKPGVRIGIRLKPGKHILVCGYTGSGKSTIIRRIIDGIDAINRASGDLHNGHRF